MECKKYDETIKREAVRLYFVEGYGYRRIANKLQLSDPSLARAWVCKYIQYGETWFHPEAKTVPAIQSIDSLSYTEMQKEIIRLRSELAYEKQKRHFGDSTMLKKRRFEIIHSLKGKYDIKTLCEAAEVSRSGYYRWREKSLKQSSRSLDDAQVLDQIKAVHIQSCETYGYRRITRVLQNCGIRINHKRVQRLMQEADIKASIRKRHVDQHPMRISGYCSNLIKQNFFAEAPNQKWVCDITYFPVEKRKLACVCILDLFRGEVIAWSYSLHATSDLVVECLSLAVSKRSCKDTIFHSDQGAQFASYAVKYWLLSHGFIQSMSRRGNCYDNARMESFFSHMKTESVALFPYHNMDELKSSINQYIEFYNHERISLKYSDSIAQ